MKKIKTFVYFDLKATGLKSSGRPRITEISDMLELHFQVMQKYAKV
jgi:hypothetical protein